ncbi:uncharacterized protein LOC119110302 [Pollicipes pollicipes]|uniref:uncharacterized protein LOC119110302 n=1 Tax=Pollicipes pollicipes TaxID=41117 RepID=UPI0018858158|nr:uncharacterized protein LOC119110302 [Pollicipes pollicipes]
MGLGPLARARARLLALLLLCLGSLLVCGVAVGGRPRRQARLVTVHHGQTIATVHFDPAGNITRCQMIEVNFPAEEQTALATISQERPVTEITFHQMMTTLRLCQQLDAVRPRRQGVFGRPRGRQWDGLALLRGLVPGTKWCGLGDSASDWNDLGPNFALDSCCRTHDLCPVKVKAYRRRYDLFNWSPYTKSHCDCDDELYRCLKAAAVPEADDIGRLYFDVLRVQCVRGPVCAAADDADTCLERPKAAGRAQHRLSFAGPSRPYRRPRRPGHAQPTDARGRGRSDAAVRGARGGGATTRAAKGGDPTAGHSQADVPREMTDSRFASATNGTSTDATRSGVSTVSSQSPAAESVKSQG